MTVTVAICTSGRDSLVHALRSIAEQARPAEKLIVVDQSGTGSAKAAAEAAGYIGDIQIVEQDFKGLSRARNAALDAFDGDWLFFTDDDCVVSRDFVEQLHKVVPAFPKAAFFAGACLWPLDFDRKTEDAPGMTVRFETVLDADTTFRDHGFMGGCLVLSRRMIDAVGKFDEEFGAGANLATGEESDYVIRAIARGLVGWTSPRLTVYHEYGARKRPEDNLLNGRLGNAALLWKFRKLGNPDGIRLAERVLPYWRKRVLINRITLGGLHADDARMSKMVSQLFQSLDAEYELDGELLKKRR